MTTLLLLVACAPTLLPFDGETPPVDDPVAAVDPLIGTGGPGFRVGSATPAATMPFGLVKLGPDSSMDGAVFEPYHCSGYYYDDDTIEGFSHVHLHGTGAIDYGDVLFMPTDGYSPAVTTADGYRSAFDHADEHAAVGWYDVTLANGIRAELSATDHTGVHRYTWPEGATPNVIIDLAHVLGGTNGGGEIHVDPVAGTIEGWMTDLGSFSNGYGGFPVYFRVDVDGGFDAYGVWGDGAPQEGGTDAAGIALGGWFQPRHNPATLQVGISLTSVQGARDNLAAERVTSPEEARAAAEAAWGALLGKVTVTGATASDQTLLYTSMYHLLQMPTRQSDVDGSYRGFDHLVHPQANPEFYSDMSLWDTYRTANPAYVLFYPDYARSFATSLVTMAKEGGAFPRWPAASGEGGSMLGAPADVVLADTWIKGVRGWDLDGAWPMLVAQERGELAAPYNARPDPTLVEELGYYPEDVVGGSVAWTQELAWADDAMARLAMTLGHTDDAAYFDHLSYSYLNQYDPETGYFRGRDSAGAFIEGFDPIAWEDEYVEGNAWQYLWMPPAHADRTAELFGGEEAARARLTTFMEGADAEGLIAGPAAYYWHGNEPDLHAPFLFAVWGDRDATATWQRWVEDQRYFATPDGLAGNDDAGTLSAWYLFSVLGFYPVAGTDRYIVGAPRFAEATFDVGDGVFTVRREGPSHVVNVPERVVSVVLNGAPLDGPYLHHADLHAGGSLVVTVENDR